VRRVGRRSLHHLQSADADVCSSPGAAERRSVTCNTSGGAAYRRGCPLYFGREGSRMPVSVGVNSVPGRRHVPRTVEPHL
jgi:hypothetical protein